MLDNGCYYAWSRVLQILTQSHLISQFHEMDEGKTPMVSCTLPMMGMNDCIVLQFLLFSSK